MDVIKDIEALINREMNKAHSYYAKHIIGPRIAFRMLGLATIALSVIIPFVSQDKFPLDDKLFWITGLSLSITVITSISTFFKPDEVWKLNMGTKLTLESLHATWQLKMLEAKSKPDQQAAIKSSFDVSKAFLLAAQSVTLTNAEGFFTNINFPEHN